MKMFKVSLAYAIYAHGPAAESGNKSAQRLLSYPVQGNSILVPVDDTSVFNELYSLAPLYTRGFNQEASWTTLYASRLIKRLDSLREAV